MKSNIKILAVAFLFLLSCSDDILDKQPLDIISDANVWNDQTLIDAYLTSSYEQTYVLLNDMTIASGQQWFEPFTIFEITDECTARWSNVANANKKFGNLKIGGGLMEWWEQPYAIIRMLNEFIQKVPNSPADDDFKKQRLAEARFLRSYNYFAMVKRYGGVPLITEPQQLNDPEEGLYPSRNTEKEVYDFILTEMEDIADDLPERSIDANLGRPSKYAALAFRSRAALYAGSIAKFGSIQLNGLLGIEASLSPNYYQIAYDAAKAIMTSSVYSLYQAKADKTENFRSLFLDENNSEVIFSRVHDYTDWNKGGNGWAWDFLQTPLPNAWSNGNQSNPYLEMAESFELRDGTSGKLDRNAVQTGLWTVEELWGDRDPRFFASIYTQGTVWKSEILDFHKGVLKADGSIQTTGSYKGILANGTQVRPNQYKTGLGVLKYLEESKDNKGDRATSGTDWIVFRYGEVLLNFAEAAFELQKNGEALDALNQIRRRAGIADVTEINREAIRHERKVELFCEGHRYWDVRRWRTAVTELTGSWSGIQYIIDPVTGKFKIYIIQNVDGVNNPPRFYDYNYYFPITIERTGQNPNLVENPGYQ